MAEARSAAETLIGSATHGDTAALADLSGLGAFGADFAAAWSTAWTAHAEAVRVGAGLMATYADVVDLWGREVTGVDHEVGAALQRTGEQGGLNA